MKKIRIFAGPNGSGKSTLIDRIRDFHKFNIGVYVCADLIEKRLKEKPFKLNFSDFNIIENISINELIRFFKNSSLYSKAKLDAHFLPKIKNNNSLVIPRKYINSYTASILCDFIKEKLLLSKNTNVFSYETVMSDDSKIDFFKNAQQHGFKVYLYFICTDDVCINIERVKERYRTNSGHNVPVDKICKRYYKSLNNLLDAVKVSDKCFLIDSTEMPLKKIAEVDSGKKVKIEFFNDYPNWFYDYFYNKTKPILN